jgi:putative ABC transport system ATP-binding protein
MPSPQTPLIEVKKLNVVYFPGKSNEVHALKDITLDIYPGEFIIFFGPSGCGKSTLLYSISGLETNVSGDVIVKGQNLPAMTKKQREVFHQKTIGMVFQAFYLIPSLSVLQNVSLPQMALNASRTTRDERALKLMERFGIAAQAGKLPQELSGGQQQRVALCRSIINDPEILFADEPVGNLDSKSSEEVMKLLRELNDRDKKTVILVTHDPSHLHNAHRVFYMRDGQIVRAQENTEAERRESPVIAEAKAETAQGQEQALGQWAKTLTAEDLRRAAEVGKDAVQAEINGLLHALTPEQRTKVEEYIRDLLAGVETHLREEDMERLARDILRLLRSPESTDTTTKVKTWKKGADVLLFTNSAQGFPLLTVAASVRLHPVFLRLKWIVIETLAFIPRRLKAGTHALSQAIRRIFVTLRGMVAALLRRVATILRRTYAVAETYIERQMRGIMGFLTRVWITGKTRAIRAAVIIRNRTVRTMATIHGWLICTRVFVISRWRILRERTVHAAVTTRHALRHGLLFLWSLLVRLCRFLTQSVRSAFDKTERTVNEVEADIRRAALQAAHTAREAEEAFITEEKREMYSDNYFSGLTTIRIPG